MQLLYSIPPLAFLLLALAAALAFACGGQLYVHRRFPSADFVQYNEVGGFIIAIVGTLYAVLLGFFTVIVWQHFSELRQQVSQESAAAADAWHTAVGLPYVVRARVRKDMVSYANIMIGSEWPAMRTGSFDPRADIIVMDAMASAGSFVPANQREVTGQLTTQQQLTVLHDERQRRLTGSQSAVSWFEWLVLFVGGFCVIGFCWLFGVHNTSIHLLMTSAVTVVIVSTLVLLFELQYPFRTHLGIGPDTWVAFMEHVHLMQTGNQMNMRM